MTIAGATYISEDVVIERPSAHVPEMRVGASEYRHGHQFVSLVGRSPGQSRPCYSSGYRTVNVHRSTGSATPGKCFVPIVVCVCVTAAIEVTSAKPRRDAKIQELITTFKCPYLRVLLERSPSAARHAAGIAYASRQHTADRHSVPGFHSC